MYSTCIKKVGMVNSLMNDEKKRIIFVLVLASIVFRFKCFGNEEIKKQVKP